MKRASLNHYYYNSTILVSLTKLLFRKSSFFGAPEEMKCNSMSCMHEESLVQVVCGWDAVQEKREEEDATKSSSIIIIIVGVYVVDERLFEDL